MDFIFSFTAYGKEAIGRARKIRVGRTEVAFAFPEDVVIHKILAGRPRDLEDVQGILVHQRDLDQSYIRRWLRELGEAVAQDFVSLFEKLWQKTRRE